MCSNMVRNAKLLSILSVKVYRHCLMNYLHQKHSDNSGAASRFVISRSPNNCYGCAMTFVTRCLKILQVLSKHQNSKKQLVASGILSELFENNIHQGPKTARVQARAALCAFSEGDINAVSVLNSLIQKKVMYCLEHHRSMDIAVASREELSLLSEVCSLADEFWESRLRVVFHLLSSSTKLGAKHPGISDHIILPCLRIISLACSCTPVMQQKDENNSTIFGSHGGSISSNKLMPEPRRKKRVASHKTQDIQLLSASAAEYFELLFKMIEPEDARLFLTVRGCLDTMCKLINKEVGNIDSLERSLHIDISQGFILHKLIELLGKFLEVPNIRSRFMQDNLLTEVLETLIVIRGLIVQKTKLISDCNQLLKDLLDSLLLESSENKRQFINACICRLQIHGEEKKGRTCLLFNPYLQDWGGFDQLQKQHQDNPKDETIAMQAAKHRFTVENFVMVSESLKTSSCGERLKDIILEKGITGLAVRHLSGSFAIAGQAGFKASSEWVLALKLPSVPFVLSMLRGLSMGHLATQRCIDEGGILPLLHALEGVSGENEIGTKAENLLDTLLDKEVKGEGANWNLFTLAIKSAGDHELLSIVRPVLVYTGLIEQLQKIFKGKAEGTSTRTEEGQGLEGWEVVMKERLLNVKEMLGFSKELLSWLDDMNSATDLQEAFDIIGALGDVLSGGFTLCEDFVQAAIAAGNL
ncbi:hypothetical protein GQ457_02G006080 [Hibiscus cannabinus]